MSFSSDVKKELSAIDCESYCCQRAEAYGMLYFGRAFGKDEISIMTDYDFVAQKYINAIKNIVPCEPEMITSKSGKVTVSVSDKDTRIDILNELGYSGNESTMRILTTNIEKECCFGAFIRGVFLSCGIITDPKKEYHLEFDVTFRSKSRDLSEMFEGFSAIPKQSDRNGVNLIYFKDSSHIEDILTVMGAHQSVLALINEKIYKDVRNNVNRKVNCDNANIKKTCEAAAEQIRAIEKLQEKDILEEIPSELKELALLRLDNPEMSLSELGANLTIPISRSGVNHRLKKLMELASKQ